jgi:hypothetical protein
MTIHRNVPGAFSLISCPSIAIREPQRREASPPAAERPPLRSRAMIRN